MTPETAMSELAGGLQLALMLAAPLLLAVLLSGVLVGILQAATQINEPTIAFVVKAVTLICMLGLTGHFLLGRLVSFTTDLFHRIPHLIG